MMALSWGCLLWFQLFYAVVSYSWPSRAIMREHGFILTRKDVALSVSKSDHVELDPQDNCEEMQKQMANSLALTESLSELVPDKKKQSPEVQLMLAESLALSGNYEGPNIQVEVDAKGNKKVKKKDVFSRNPRDRTGYNFTDEFGEYDVPIIDVPMWFRIQVRRNSERKFTENINKLRMSSERWGKIITNAFYPTSAYVKFKGKELAFATKPMTPGLVYLKLIMNPDVADDLETIKGVYGFVKNSHRLVLPISEEEGKTLEAIQLREADSLESDAALIRKDEYVSIVSGPHAGKYGIVMGCRNGKLEICIRSDYKDDWDVVEVYECRYLAEPPEKKVSEMTAKEAVLSLMSKDPSNPTIKALKKNGMLKEILYADEGDQRGERGQFDRRDRDEMMGREGGRSVRSIAKDKDKDKDSRGRTTGMENGVRPTTRSHQEVLDFDMDGWGTKRPVPTAGKEQDDTEMELDGFNVNAWSKQLSAAGVRGKGSGSVSDTGPKSSANKGSDIDSFINEIMAEQPLSIQDQDSSSKTMSSGSGSGIVNNNGRREWVPKNLPDTPRKDTSPPRSSSRDRTNQGSGSWYADDASNGLSNTMGKNGGDFEYDPYADSSSSSSGSFRSTSRTRDTTSSSTSSRSSNAVTTSGSDDADRILNELLREMDEGSGSGGKGKSRLDDGLGSLGVDSLDGLDLFDFPDDDEDEDKKRRPSNRPFSNSPPSSSSGLFNSPSRSSASTSTSGKSSGGGVQAGGGGRNQAPAPKMEDFESFEQYLDALVNHERSSSASNNGQSAFQSRRGGSSYSNNQGGNRGLFNNPDSDNLDDDIVDLLGDVRESNNNNDRDRSFSGGDRGYNNNKKNNEYNRRNNQGQGNGQFSRDGYSNNDRSETSSTGSGTYVSRSGVASDSPVWPAREETRRAWSPSTGTVSYTPYNTADTPSSSSSSSSSSSNKNTKSNTNSRNSPEKVVEDDGEAYDEIDSFLNSLEVSNVLAKATSDPVISKASAATTKSNSGSTKNGSSRSSNKVMSDNSDSNSDPTATATKKSTSDGVKMKKKVVSESTNYETPYAEMTVSALKERCKAIGLPVGGTKAELLSRLTER